jgi:hypothetical protein
LLNTTRLDFTNVQLNRLLATTQAASQVAVTSASGTLTLAAFVTPAQGGTGFSYTPVLADAGKTLKVNSAGTALTFDAVADGSLKILQFFRFT